MLKLTRQQIEQLNNLPKCKNCGDGVKPYGLILGVNYVSLMHNCPDKITDVTLEGSFEYVVAAWVAINGNLLEEIYNDIRRGVEASKELRTNKNYEQGWRDSLQQLANIMVVKYGGGDD